MAAVMSSAADRAMVRVTEIKWSVCTLSDVLQDVKDQLHHNRLVASLAPPAVNDRDQRAVDGVQVLSWERLPVAASHKSDLKLQNKPLITLNILTQ